MSFHDKTAVQVTNITINVKNLSEMIDFYTNIIGLTVALENKNSAILKVGSNGHTITLYELREGRHPSMKESGLFHVALLLPTIEDLADFLFHVSKFNIPIGGGDHLVSEAIYLSDPEGNGIEVYYDKPLTHWLWENNKVKMDTLRVDFNDLINKRTKKGWQQMTSNSKIGHLHLKTSNLELAQQFYINELGLEQISDFPQALFMSTNYYHHHIAVNTWQSNIVRISNASSYGLRHIDIYNPSSNKEETVTVDGIDITLHNNESLVSDKD
ncbi:VOC family protein [Mammaliicoccus lentus]|uniref:VOC family protein n=1 Tax=Mammaliicoccus lentus TaxID=42858 RepID=UPI001B3312D4|nr:VOC family protein [Mammaliicoccus lentus]